MHRSALWFSKIILVCELFYSTITSCMRNTKEQKCNNTSHLLYDWTRSWIPVFLHYADPKGSQRCSIEKNVLVKVLEIKIEGLDFRWRSVGVSREATVLYIISCYKSHRMSRRGEMKIEIPARHCSVKIYLLDIPAARDSRRRTDIAIMLRHLAR